MSIDKSQWGKIANELQGMFCHIQFKYQDTVISLVRERASESKTHLVVYFNGKINFSWSNEASEQYNPLTKLFWCTKTRSLFKPKTIAEAEKKLGKRYVKKEMSYLYDKQKIIHPLFSSSTALIRQYKKVDGLTWLENCHD